MRLGSLHKIQAKSMVMIWKICYVSYGMTASCYGSYDGTAMMGQLCYMGLSYSYFSRCKWFLIDFELNDYNKTDNDRK